MACLNLSNGDFSFATFSTGNINAGSITVTRTATSVSVAHAAYAAPLVLNGDFRVLLFGGNRYLALLRIDSNAGFGTRTVSIVDFTAAGPAPGLVQVHQQPGVADSVSLPAILTAPGSEDLVLVSSATGTPNEVRGLGIFRSDNGVQMLAGPLTVSGLSAVVGGEVTATSLVIHHPNSFGADSTTGPRPAGELSISGPGAFGEAVLGASAPGLATATRVATLRNTGSDCLTISAIADAAPFAVTATSRPLPAVLDVDQTLDVTIRFAPAAAGSFSRTLAVTRSPANGAAAIACSGTARDAVARITTSTASIAFGTLVHPGTATSSFTVRNTGDIDLAIGIAAPPPGSDFAWAAVAALALAAGAQSPPQAVTYTTSGPGPALPQTLTVTPTQGAARNVQITGAACVAEPRITVPAAAPTAFGPIERGFRSVRVLTVRNTGSADLAFSARIQGPQAALFGLVLAGGDITDAPPTRSYTVLPASRCGAGASGSGLADVAVSFFADGANGPCSAELVIEGHNAVNEPAARTWVFALNAEIIDAVPVDIALVIDNSGSMADSVGSRTKLQAALTASQLLVQMLRDTAADRCSIVSYETTPQLRVAQTPVASGRGALLAMLGGGAIAPAGATNIAGGAVLGSEQLALPHPDSPPLLKKAMVVLTDGMENRCWQAGGTGPWLSITGRGAAQGMRRPDATPQDTAAWTPTPGHRVYAIGLGAAADIDSAALTQLATATGASYQGAEDLSGMAFFNLEKYFTQIFMEAAGLAQISDPFWTIPAGDRHTHGFDVLPGDVGCMLVVYDSPGQRLPFFVQSPKGELFSGGSLPAGFSLRLRSTPTARFVELGFPQAEPERSVGGWTVTVEHPGLVCEGPVGGKSPGADDDGPAGFQPRKCRESKSPVLYGLAVGVGSNLRLQPWVDPQTVFVGQSFRLNAELQEAGLPVTGATVRVHITGPTGATWTLPLLDDAAHEDGQAGDGDYGGRFSQTTAAGHYQLTFVAEGQRAGKSWRREAHRSKPVFDPRQPPGGGEPGDTPPGGGGTGADGRCCERQLQELARQRRTLVVIALLVFVALLLLLKLLP